ncbi:MAG: pantoate--beta-alanine ligase [Acidimicrobiales bacterium]
MAVLPTPAETAKAMDAERLIGRRVGLVPTMGALHAGHISLIERAADECEAVLVSVFVNPLQFGAAEDFGGYPRDLARDIRLAAGAGTTHVFIPDVEAMYPDGFLSLVRVHELGDDWEGAARPGHFDGVTTVVTKLFSMAGRCRAYFGEKDFQQLQVVRRLANDLCLPAEVIGCPTVREPDGLALSSRNAYLTPAERAAAPKLYRALLAGVTAIEAGETAPARVAAVMAAEVGSEPIVRLSYAAAVDPVTLRPPARLEGGVRLLVAARLGRTRLIDNLGCAVPGGARARGQTAPGAPEAV